MICPFLDLLGEYEDTCVYCEDGICDDIEINASNGDAFCREQIEKAKIIEKTVDIKN